MAESNSSISTAPVNYNEYIQSPEWKAKRSAAIVRAGGRCQVCNRPGDLHAHHRTYERLGRELPMDLTVLCVECHDLFHKHRAVEGWDEPTRGVEASVVETVDLVAFARELAAAQPESAPQERKPAEPENGDVDGKLRARAEEHARNYPGFDADRFMEWACSKPYPWRRWSLSRSISELNKKRRRDDKWNKFCAGMK